jgi:hypothetical protein
VSHGLTLLLALELVLSRKLWTSVYLSSSAASGLLPFSGPRITSSRFAVYHSMIARRIRRPCTRVNKGASRAAKDAHLVTGCGIVRRASRTTRVRLMPGERGGPAAFDTLNLSGLYDRCMYYRPFVCHGP